MNHMASKKNEYQAGYALENPLSGVELTVGLFTGALGFGTSDFVDRYLATHALTDKNAKDANGNELYADTPPTTGSYQKLFNGTAVQAPMNLPRWGVGVALAGVPFVAAAFVKAPAGRSALQMFGFGAALRTLGKGLTDGVAYLTAKTAVGQRLYDDRQRAMAITAEASGATPVILSASLPSAGLGSACDALYLAESHAKIKQLNAATMTPPPGYPSPTKTPTPGAAPPSPPAPQPKPPPTLAEQFPAKVDPFNWGEKPEAGGKYNW